MSFVKDTFNTLTGGAAAEAAGAGAGIQSAAIDRAIAAREAASEKGLGFLDPFSQVGQQGIEQAGFLTDPQAQFEFLQNNPLFQMGLENLNTQTQQAAATRGRLSAGDTLQQLTSNALLAASPLISQQKQSIGDLLNLGTGVAGAQASTATGTGVDIADLITSQGAVEAGGVIGAENARTQALQGMLGLGGSLGAASILATSDKRLKENIRLIGFLKGFNIYSWDWNTLAQTLGLKGKSFGVIAQEVIKTRPDAVVDDGYLKVNYELLGIPHGN
jgi:hypothetical protein